MIFKGDLSKYHPADAMTFLSQIGLDGILSVADRECFITLTFKAGMLLDAQSARGDQKLIRCLLHQGRLNDNRVRHLQQIQKETGLSVRQILGKLKLVALDEIQNDLKLGVLEVLRQLFLLDQGSFNFTETPVEDDGAGIRMDTAKATLTILPQADEFRDFIKNIQTADRKVQLNGNRNAIKDPGPSERLVLKYATQQSTVNDLLEKTPLPSHEVLQCIQRFLDQKIIALLSPEKTSAAVADPIVDPLFSAYKQALKTVLRNHDVVLRLGALLSFCKLYYDDMLVLTARQGRLVHCKTIRMNQGKGLSQKSMNGSFGHIDDDPFFSTVCRSGIAFFGKTFPSRLLDEFIEQHPNGDCALIPILLGPAISIFLYSGASRSFSGLSPHHYLELLSWIVAPARTTALHPPTAPAHTPRGDSVSRTRNIKDNVDVSSSVPPDEDSKTRIADMVARINELPPLPTVVSKSLEMLSDPETPLEEIETVISQDQALVATLIKVGNSALYGGMQKVTSLHQVLARLGIKITRNLILSASTRSYFHKNRKGMRMWGQFLWRHAVESALAARRIAETINYPDPEEAFIGGLVHDIGKLTMLMLFPESYREILKVRKVNQVNHKTAEIQVVGYDHEQVGRLLMNCWNMPDSARACAEFHHRCHESGAYGLLTAIVAYADYLSRQYGANPESLLAEDHTYAHEIIATLNLSESMQADLVDTLIHDFQEAESMME